LIDTAPPLATSRSSLDDVLVLTLDTSTSAVTAAVSGVRPRRAVATLASRHEVAVNRHGELLAPMIDAVLREAGAAPADLDAVGVGLGPGPFTGLRVGIMTAAAMADALAIPAYGGCSLDVIAHSVRSDECSYAVMTDARRKQVYWASYDEIGRRVDGPDVGTPAAVAEHLAGRVTHVAGSGATLYRKQLAGFTLVEGHEYPDAAVLAQLMMKPVLKRAPGDQLTPLYLRRPDATPPGRPKQVTPA
jgi:tRNA threonylcarbamoyl adenosine modification protein YeaZ